MDKCLSVSWQFTHAIHTNHWEVNVALLLLPSNKNLRTLPLIFTQKGVLNCIKYQLLLQIFQFLVNSGYYIGHFLTEQVNII